MDVNEKYKNDLTALMWAAGYGSKETTAKLLAAGASQAFKDNRGKSALDIATEKGHNGVADLLRESLKNNG